MFLQTWNSVSHLCDTANCCFPADNGPLHALHLKWPNNGLLFHCLKTAASLTAKVEAFSPADVLPVGLLPSV